jgi:hypothetical protein
MQEMPSAAMPHLSDGGEPVTCRTLDVRLASLAADLQITPWEQDAAAQQGLIHRIHKLRRDMQDHNRAVRGPDGLLRCLADDCPRLTIGADRLLEQHEVLIERLAVLGAAVTSRLAGDSPEAWVRRVRRLARRLARTMQLHQQQGNALIIEAYSGDYDLAAAD